MSARKVGFVISTTGTGGMEKWLIRVLNRIRGLARAVVYVRSSSPGYLDADFRATGADIVYMPLGYAHPIRVLRFRNRLLHDQLYALVDLTGVFASVSLTLAASMHIPCRVAFHRRSTFAFNQGNPFKNLYARLSLALIEQASTAIMSNSAEALKCFHPALLEQRDPRLQVVRNFIEPGELLAQRSSLLVRQEINVPLDAFILVHVGRVDPAKDHKTLIAAASKVMAEHSDVYCMLVGPGTECLDLEHMGCSSLVRDRFRLLGNRTDVADLCHAADLFVFTSVTEGMPNALVEAMLCGLPVVASCIPSIKEIIPERGHQTLVHPGDIEGFSAALRNCYRGKLARAERIFLEEVQEMTDPQKALESFFDVILG